MFESSQEAHRDTERAPWGEEVFILPFPQHVHLPHRPATQVPALVDFVGRDIPFITDTPATKGAF
ncbi:hypothetical protein V8C42DRAFT_338944 [Trichoderma barbatum]